MAEKKWRLPADTRMSLSALGEITAGPDGIEVTIGKNCVGWYIACVGQAYVTRGWNPPRKVLERLHYRGGSNASTFSAFCMAHKKYEV